MGPKLMGKFSFGHCKRKTNSLNRQPPSDSELDDFPRALHFPGMVLLPSDDHRPRSSATLLGKP